jgi:hypothetical protein
MKASILSLYVGYALYAVFPWKDAVEGVASSSQMVFFVDVIMFAVACGIAHFALRRSVSDGFRDWWRTALLALLTLAFLLAVLYQTFGMAHTIHLPAIFTTLFAADAYFFWWFIAPLVALLIIA